ncbi:Transposase [Fusobacterium necrophorum subsp. funduliforme]
MRKKRKLKKYIKRQIKKELQILAKNLEREIPDKMTSNLLKVLDDISQA